MTTAFQMSQQKVYLEPCLLPLHKHTCVSSCTLLLAYKICSKKLTRSVTICSSGLLATVCTVHRLCHAAASGGWHCQEAGSTCCATCACHAILRLPQGRTDLYESCAVQSWPSHKDCNSAPGKQYPVELRLTYWHLELLNAHAAHLAGDIVKATSKVHRSKFTQISVNTHRLPSCKCK